MWMKTESADLSVKTEPNKTQWHMLIVLYARRLKQKTKMISDAWIKKLKGQVPIIVILLWLNSILG